MYKSLISPGLIRYSFDPMPGHYFSENIYALVSGRKALLIDAGYENEAKEVVRDLSDKGILLDGIIISHFHDDHMQGLKVISGIPVYGSGRYHESLDMWTEKEEQLYFTPAVRVEDCYSLDFEEHSLLLIPFPGHSPCTLLTLIDGTYLHIADELMFSVGQEPILPAADTDCVERHIASLKSLKSYKQYVFLPAHGQPFSGEEEIEIQIDKRLIYFNAVHSAGGNITYEEAVKDCGGFVHGEWHKYNCEHR